MARTIVVGGGPVGIFTGMALARRAAVELADIVNRAVAAAGRIATAAVPG